MTAYDRRVFLLPYEMTSRLMDELNNLRLKPTGIENKYKVERISRSLEKDRFSALEYALYRVKYYEDKEIVVYSPNYLVSIVSNEIPKRIAQMATIVRLMADTPPEDWKPCIHCGKSFPKNPIFFSRNNAHKDGLSNTCKACDKANRI